MTNGFSVDEKTLLDMYRRAKDLSIQRLLNQYGTSLGEVREMVPQLTQAIEQQRLATHLQTEPFFFSKTEAAVMGLDIDENWLLKMTPGAEGYQSSLITGEKWEITESGAFISPTGEQYTRQELETALGVGLAPEVEYPLGIEQIFGSVFPQQEIQEVLTYAQSEPEAFLQDIREIGRSPETEALLRAMYESVTEDWLTYLFAPEEFLSEMRAAGRTPDTETRIRELFPEITEEELDMLFAELEAAEEERITPEEYPGWFRFLFGPIGEIAPPAEPGEPYTGISGPFGGPPIWESPHWIAGWGDVYAVAGGTLRWLGADGIADLFSSEGQRLQEVAPPDMLGEFNWKMLFNPRFYTTRVLRALPFTLTLIPAAIIGGYAGLATAGALKLGTLGKWILGSIGAAGLSRPLESAMEAGGAFDDAISAGFSREEADEIADEVFNKNMTLMGLDAVEFALAFAPQPVKVGNKFLRYVYKGMRIAAVGLSEAGEEAYQDVIQRWAMGQEVKLDPQMKEAMAIGGIFGFGLGGAGDVFTSIQNRVKDKLNYEQTTQLRAITDTLLAQGYTEKQAKVLSLDVLAARHEETIRPIVDEAVNEVRQEGFQQEVDSFKPTGLAKDTKDLPSPDILMPVGDQVGIGVRDVGEVFPQSGVTETELTIPSSKDIIDGMIIPNWIRTSIVSTAKVPFLKKVYESVFGWRTLVNKDSQLTGDIVGRAGVAYGAIKRMGVDVSKVEINTLKDIISNPVKYFGFNKAGYSGKMASRLLPEYEAHRAEAGTLEHVFTEPEMYNWTGLDQGLRYATRVNRINAAVHALLGKEGVGLDAVDDRWIHRVVTGRTVEGEVVQARGRPGRTGRRPGAVPSYKKPRTFKTMAEGIQALVEYEPNIEVSVGSYIEEAYKEVAGERFKQLVEEFGVTPTERLLERFPEIAERAETTKTELADAAYLRGAIGRAGRGERLPGQTLTALENRFPEIGRRLRALVKEPKVENELRGIIKQNDRYIRDLKRQLAKAPQVVKVATAAAEAKRATPAIVSDEAKLREAFTLWDYEDRLAMRSTLEGQLEEIAEGIGRQQDELSGIEDFLKTEPLATYIGKEVTYTTAKGKKVTRKYKITDVLVRGKMPETLTPAKAKYLLMGREIKPGAYDKAGNIRWEYIVDELAEHFGMGEQEMVNSIESLGRQEERAVDIKNLIDSVNARSKGIKRMLSILEDVESKPEAVAPPPEPALQEQIPEADFAMPEQVPQKEQIVKWREYSGLTMKQSPQEALDCHGTMKYYAELITRRLERLKKTQARNPEWKSWSEEIDEYISIDTWIEMQEALLLEYYDQILILEEAMRKAGVVYEAYPMLNQLHPAPEVVVTEAVEVTPEETLGELPAKSRQYTQAEEYLREQLFSEGMIARAIQNKEDIPFVNYEGKLVYGRALGQGVQPERYENGVKFKAEGDTLTIEATALTRPLEEQYLSRLQQALTEAITSIYPGKDYAPLSEAAQQESLDHLTRVVENAKVEAQLEYIPDFTRYVGFPSEALSRVEGAVNKGLARAPEAVEPAVPSPEIATGQPYSATVYRGYKPGAAPTDEGLFGKGTYYTTNREYAETYDGQEVMRVTLNNPFVINNQQEAEAFWNEVTSPVRNQALDEVKTPQEADELAARAATKWLQDRGHDGLIARDIIAPGDEVVVFDPKKSLHTYEVREREARYGFLQLNEAEYQEAIGQGRYPDPEKYKKLTRYYTETRPPGWKGLSLAQMFPEHYKDLSSRGVPNQLSSSEIRQVVEERRIPYELREEPARYAEEHVFYVDPARLQWQLEGKEGDINASYSADRIAEKKPVRKPFIFNGEEYVAVGAFRGPGEAAIERAYRIIPRDQFAGEAHWYGEIDHAIEREQPEGFYHGMLVNHKGKEYVLVGPEITFRAKVEGIEIPKAPPGMPEAGVQVDFFGYQKPVTPSGKGKLTQIGMDDYSKLAKAREEAGQKAPEVFVKPKVEGIKDLSGETQIARVAYSMPAAKTAKQQREAFKELTREAKALEEGRKAPYWQARYEKEQKMKALRGGDIGEGYLPMPFAGGKIYGQDFIDVCNKFFGQEKGHDSLRFTSDAAGILRMTKAALDFSAMSIQGMPSFGLAHGYLVRNPIIGAKLIGSWYKAFVESTVAFFNPGVFYGHMARNEAAALQRISFGGSSRAIDYFEVLKARHGVGRIAAWVFNKMPLKPYQRAEIAFYSAGEIVRNEFWKILSPKAIEQGKAFELARSLDLSTGLAQAEAQGVPLTVRQLESSFMWFAPNYTRACLTFLGDMFRGGYTGAFTKTALGGMIGSVIVYYMGIQMATALLSGKDEDDAMEAVKEGLGIREDPITHEVIWKPRSDFLSIKIGNYTFGLGSFWYGLVRLAGNIMECIEEVGNRERVDLYTILKNGAPNKDNPFVYWWFTRSSPLTGMAFELATQKDFLGYPIETPWEYAHYIMTRFEPIWMEQGINWLIPGMARDQEIPEDEARAAIIPFELFGWRSVPESAWVNFYQKAEEYITQIPRHELDEKQVEAWQAGKLQWSHLTGLQKQNLLDRYPDLTELYETALNDSRVRQSPEWAAYTDRVDEERAIYHDRIDEYTRRLQDGEIDTRKYRNLCSEAGQNYGSIMEAISRDPTYADIFNYFDKKEAEGTKYEFTFDLALAEYDSRIRFADDPDISLPNGDYNWDERDRRIDQFIEKWGEGLYNTILDYISKEREEKGLSPVWIRRGQDTELLSREYWQLPYQPLVDMTEEDFEEGSIPAEHHALWQTYQTLPDEEKDGYAELHPTLNKDWRAEYRRNNPQADAMLALWGYGGKLQSMEAYNLVTQWSQELGIPLESMGLGLPPRTLIDDYFGYNQVSTEFSGNSAEAKLWRLENTEFTDWAVENWGWEGTGDYKSIDYYRLQVKWADKESEYAAIDGDIARQEFLKSNTEYWTAKLTIGAMDKEFPEKLIPQYVEWYQADFSDYEDDWWLMEHKDFYDTMYDLELWTEPRDFTKVPSRAVWTLYQSYLGLPTGSPRLDFRAKNPELDAWLVLKYGYKPIADRGKAEAETTPWEELEEVERFEELF